MLNMRKRAIAFGKVSLLGLGILGVLGFLVTHSVSLPCLFHQITGFDCPGCGMTRSVIAFLHGNWMQAERWNGFSLPIFFLFGYFWVQLGRKYIQLGKVAKFEEIFSQKFLSVFCFLFLLYGILRNF